MGGTRVGGGCGYRDQHHRGNIGTNRPPQVFNLREINDMTDGDCETRPNLVEPHISKVFRVESGNGLFQVALPSLVILRYVDF